MLCIILVYNDGLDGFMLSDPVKATIESLVYKLEE